MPLRIWKIHEDPLPGSDCSQRHVLEIEQRSQQRGGCTWWDEADEVGTQHERTTSINQHQPTSVNINQHQSSINQHQVTVANIK